MELLKDKVAIVTGGGSGIGKATALLFAKHGASVIVADIDEENGEAVVQEIKERDGKATFIMADASKREDAKRTVDATLEAFDTLDIAVNNAGIGPPPQTIGGHDMDDWNNTLDLNLTGVFYGMHYQIPVMEEAGQGSIINMASVLGKRGLAQNGAYVASKHGLVGLTKNAALEYGESGIRINAVGPAFIRTPALEHAMSEEEIEQMANQHAMKRLGTPEEVAEMVLWLASDKASFSTGGYYPVDGGYLAS